MRIIFNSEEEKKKFFDEMADSDRCPSDMGLHEPNNCDNWNCTNCWQLAIPHEVKER